MKKKITIAIFTVSVLVGGQLIFLMRYQQVENVLGEDFTDTFVLHNITIDSGNPVRPDGSGFDFHERHATQFDRYYSDEFFTHHSILSEYQINILLNLLLEVQVRPYNLRAHPIIFNAFTLQNIDPQLIDPPFIVNFQFFDQDKQNVVFVMFRGAEILSIGTGEVTEYGWGANERFGLNPTIFRIHEFDQSTLFEILRTLDGDTPF